jgi:hypothetical protein
VFLGCVRRFQLRARLGRPWQHRSSPPSQTPPCRFPAAGSSGATPLPAPRMGDPCFVASSDILSICGDIAYRVLSLGYVSFRQIRAPVPPFPPVGPVAAPCGSPAVPHLHRYYGFVRLLIHPYVFAYGLPWRSHYRSGERRWRALLGSWGIPLETCPELETPAIPVRPSRFAVVPGTAFRSLQRRRHRNNSDFGAESSRPASLLCTLRTHQSPGEWQHSLPACSLALTGRDLHPLDSIEWFHLLPSVPPLPSFSQRDEVAL